MDSLASFLIGEHISDLRREADATRLARAAADRNQSMAPERTRSGWRRTMGGGARHLSRRLALIAAQLDPTVPSRPSYGRE